MQYICSCIATPLFASNTKFRSIGESKYACVRCSMNEEPTVRWMTVRTCVPRENFSLATDTFRCEAKTLCKCERIYGKIHDVSEKFYFEEPC